MNNPAIRHINPDDPYDVSYRRPAISPGAAILAQLLADDESAEALASVTYRSHFTHRFGLAAALGSAGTESMRRPCPRDGWRRQVRP